MEPLFRKILAGHEFIFADFEHDGETKYEIAVAEYLVFMMIKDDVFKLFEPQSIPTWILELEEQLSEAIHCHNL